jgi:DNA-binding NarL/FixJ family response regulator
MPLVRSAKPTTRYRSRRIRRKSGNRPRPQGLPARLRRCKHATMLATSHGPRMTFPAPAGTAIVDHARLRIVLVDDHAIVREGVRAVLEENDDFNIVGEFGSGDEALAGAAALAPDVALVDLKMPGLGPVDTIRGLHERVPGIRVLVFTSFGEDAMIRATLDAGATGFLIKDALQDDLVRAIRSVAAGQPYLAPAAQRQLMELLRKPTSTREALTPRESAVLQLIAQGQSNKQIGRQLHLTEGTVKGYVSQILAKLQLEDRTQAALYAVRNGLVDGDSVA